MLTVRVPVYLKCNVSKFSQANFGEKRCEKVTSVGTPTWRANLKTGLTVGLRVQQLNTKHTKLNTQILKIRRTRECRPAIVFQRILRKQQTSDTNLMMSSQHAFEFFFQFCTFFCLLVSEVSEVCCFPGTPPFWRTRNEFCTVWNSARWP